MQNRYSSRASIMLLLLMLALQLALCGISFAETTDLAKIINDALADPVLRHGIQGVVIESLVDGRALYERNSDLALMPASNLKLVVSAAALELLGPDHRIPTSLYVTGEQTPEGVLKGNVILEGKGDPIFEHEHLQAMAAAIKAMGIKVVEGEVIGDDTWFDNVPLGWGWAWDDESFYYAAQVSALNLNENVVDVWVRPGRRAGAPATVKVTPPTGYMVVRNECTTSSAGSEKSIFVERVRGRNTIRVTGTVPLDYKPERAEEAITVEDPTIFACHTLIEMLGREGIEVTGGPARGTCPKDARLVMTHESLPLSDLLALLNKPSDNLIAECLLKYLGAQFKGTGSAAAGEQVELDFLRSVGLDMTAVGIVDGSGLSRHNYISPANIMTLLKHMYRHKNQQVFIDSLPIAGVDGTLRNRMTGTPAERNVRAKTGYLNRVSTVSGFMTTRSGEHLVFCIMMNNHLCRNREATAVQDRILAALADLGK